MNSGKRFKNPWNQFTGLSIKSASVANYKSYIENPLLAMKASRGFFCLLELHQRKYMPHFFRCGLNLTAELFNLCNAADQVKCLDMFDFSPYI